MYHLLYFKTTELQGYMYVSDTVIHFLQKTKHSCGEMRLKSLFYPIVLK